MSDEKTGCHLDSSPKGLLHRTPRSRVKSHYQDGRVEKVVIDAHPVQQQPQATKMVLDDFEAPTSMLFSDHDIALMKHLRHVSRCKSIRRIVGSAPLVTTIALFATTMCLIDSVVGSHMLSWPRRTLLRR